MALPDSIAGKSPVARAMAVRRQILNFGRKPEFKRFVFGNKKISAMIINVDPRLNSCDEIATEKKKL
ncbi:MAG: hypothetical protein DRH50_05570 [Deltaproteobacteria bacterium]|nr:MAG: hypothetical protein DRH50_05570 [Deltaproteobacteria bacterium]